jgi:hypothetical protein
MFHPKMLSALISIVFVLGLLKNYIHLLWTFKNNVFIKVSEHSKSEITNAVLKSSSENYSSFWLHSLFGCQTTRTISEDKSARILQLGPYYCFIILLNIYIYYIMILFKQFYWLSCCHLTFRKIWYCLIKTRIDLVSLSFSVIKQLQSFVSVNTSFYGP